MKIRKMGNSPIFARPARLTTIDPRLSWSFAAVAYRTHLQYQAGLDRGIAEPVLASTLTAWGRHPDDLGIKPNRKRSVLLQRYTIRRSVLGLVVRRGPTAHVFQLSCWIHTVNLRRNSCNKAPSGEKVYDWRVMYLKHPALPRTWRSPEYTESAVRVSCPSDARPDRLSRRVRPRRW